MRWFSSVRALENQWLQFIETLLLFRIVSSERPHLFQPAVQPALGVG